jgi:hypothetical protein
MTANESSADDNPRLWYISRWEVKREERVREKLAQTVCKADLSNRLLTVTLGGHARRRSRLPGIGVPEIIVVATASLFSKVTQARYG